MEACYRDYHHHLDKHYITVPTQYVRHCTHTSEGDRKGCALCIIPPVLSVLASVRDTNDTWLGLEGTNGLEIKGRGEELFHPDLVLTLVWGLMGRGSNLHIQSFWQEDSSQIMLTITKEPAAQAQVGERMVLPWAALKAYHQITNPPPKKIQS